MGKCQSSAVEADEDGEGGWKDLSREGGFGLKDIGGEGGEGAKACCCDHIHGFLLESTLLNSFLSPHASHLCGDVKQTTI